MQLVSGATKLFMHGFWLLKPYGPEIDGVPISKSSSPVSVTVTDIVLCPPIGVAGKVKDVGLSLITGARPCVDELLTSRTRLFPPSAMKRSSWLSRATP